MAKIELKAACQQQVGIGSNVLRITGKKVNVNETLSMQCSQELFNTEWRRKRFAPAYEGNMLTRTTDRMDYNVFDYITVVTAG